MNFRCYSCCGHLRSPWIYAVVLICAACHFQFGIAQEGNANKGKERGGAEAPIHVLNALIEAFNDHAPKKMTKQVDQAVELYYVDEKGKSERAVSSASELEKEMVGYFRAIPDVSSTIEDPTVVGRFISVRERAEWTRQGKKFSQSSLAVYEILNGKIRRVWYYPAQL